MDSIKEKNSFDNVLWQKKEEIIEITNETEIEVTSVTVSSLITSIIQMRIQQLREEGATEDIDLAPALLDYYRRHMAGGDK